MRPGGYLLYDSSWPLDAALHPRRHHDPRRPLRQDVRRGVRARSRPHAAAQHRLRRRAGGAARDRHGRRRRGAAREVRARRRRCSTRTSRPSASATTTRRRTSTCPLPFHLERMNATTDYILIDGNTAVGARRRVRRRDGRRVVSDHAGHVADGGVQGVLRAYRVDPGRRRRSSASSRRRTNSPRPAW